MSPVETGLNTSMTEMQPKKYEKIEIIGKIMQSYRQQFPKADDEWFSNKFDKLYDMPEETLLHLANLRKINTMKLHNELNY